MKIIINSRKYKLPTQFEMLDLGMPDEFETKEDVLKALKTLDEIAQTYKEQPMDSSRAYRIAKTKDYMVLNKIDGLLYPREPDKKLKVEINKQEVDSNKVPF